jgi:hypothetical protein
VLQTCVGGVGCWHAGAHGFLHELFWENAVDAKINDATIQGFDFVSKLNIFSLFILDE